jgi:hypothetical protein
MKKAGTPYYEQLLIRIREKLDPTGERDREVCWIWQGKKNRQGYGKLWSKEAPGKEVLAHRASYEAFTGCDPQDQCVLHTCDVPSCCNPDHLYVGTRKDNAEDRVDRDRQARGENHGQAQLKAVDVWILRERYARKEPLAEIARDLGISYKHAWKIAKGHTWRST